jgi:GT2 family glycosyltransferase
MSEKDTGGGPPLASVIIPTRSRPEQLKLCLTALSRDGDEVPKEVIIIDDGSPLRLAVEIEASAGATDVQLLRQQGAGPAAARNRGAAEARGKLLIFLDDDCRPQPGWLEAIVRELKGSDPILVGGPIINGSTANIFSEATQLLVDYVSHRSVTAGLAWGFLPSCNLAISRESFARLGGFDESFSFAGGEDREFCARALRQGLEIRFLNDVVVRHFHELNFATYLQKHFRYGRGAVLYRRQLAAKHGAFHVPLRWYLGLMGIPFDGRRLAQAVPLAFLLALAQLATAFGAARQAASWIRLKRD